MKSVGRQEVDELKDVGGGVESRLTVMKDPFSAEPGPFYDLLNCIGRLIKAA